MTDYTCNAKLVDREDLTPELAVMRVAPLVNGVPEFTPGQYAELTVPGPVAPEVEDGAVQRKIIRRSYSIASSPLVKEHLEFYVVLVPNGEVTPKLWALKKGDLLWLGPKIKGKFSMEGLDSSKDFVMVSTGTGIAPYISMLRTYRGKGRWRRFVVMHGVRLAEDLGYRQELEELSERDSSIVYVPTVTREPDNSTWTGCRGRVTEYLKPDTYFNVVGSPLDPNNCNVFLCGNPEMIDSAEALLVAQGFRLHSKKNPGNIHLERYW